MKELTDLQYSGLASNGKINVIQMAASWCGPCRLLKPKLERLEDNFLADEVEFFKMDVESEAETRLLFNIKSIPTVVILKDGQEVSRFNSPVNIQDVEATIQQIQNDEEDTF